MNLLPLLILHVVGAIGALLLGGYAYLQAP